MSVRGSLLGRSLSFLYFRNQKHTTGEINRAHKEHARILHCIPYGVAGGTCACTCTVGITVDCGAARVLAGLSVALLFLQVLGISAYFLDAGITQLTPVVPTVSRNAHASSLAFVRAFAPPE